MIGYRVTSAAHIAQWEDAFTGIGSYQSGGRWSSPGTKMVYSSTHMSLSALEILVHARKNTFLKTRVVVRFELRDGLVRRLDDPLLPLSWDAFPAPASAQHTGDEWVRSKVSMGLLVPTAILPAAIRIEEKNLLLNPDYPEFLSEIKKPEIIRFNYDKRITDLIVK